MVNRRALRKVLALLTGVIPGLALALTPERVQQWQEATEALQAHAQEQSADDWHPAAELRGVGESETAFRVAVQRLERPEAALEPHGYSDKAGWAEEGARIHRALIALEIGDLRALQAQLEEAKEQIEANPQLGAAAKAGIIADIEAQKERLIDFVASIPDEDREAVASRQEQLMELLRP